MILLLLIAPFLILVAGLCLAKNGFVVIGGGIIATIIMACACIVLPQMMTGYGDGAANESSFSLIGLGFAFVISLMAYLIAGACLVQKRRQKENPFKGVFKE
jgi:hypothetical protein